MGALTYRDPSTGNEVPAKHVDGAVLTTLALLIAGERRWNSVDSYLRAFPTANATRCDTDTTETLITASPGVVLAIIGNDGNTGYSAIRNAAATGGPSTPLTLPNVADGGSVDCHGLVCDTGITIQGESVGHDVTVIWAPL